MSGLRWLDKPSIVAVGLAALLPSFADVAVAVAASILLTWVPRRSAPSVAAVVAVCFSMAMAVDFVADGNGQLADKLNWSPNWHPALSGVASAALATVGIAIVRAMTERRGAPSAPRVLGAIEVASGTVLILLLLPGSWLFFSYGVTTSGMEWLADKQRWGGDVPTLRLFAVALVCWMGVWFIVARNRSLVIRESIDVESIDAIQCPSQVAAALVDGLAIVRRVLLIVGLAVVAAMCIYLYGYSTHPRVPVPGPVHFVVGALLLSAPWLTAVLIAAHLAFRPLRLFLHGLKVRESDGWSAVFDVAASPAAPLATALLFVTAYGWMWTLPDVSFLSASAAVSYVLALMSVAFRRSVDREIEVSALTSHIDAARAKRVRAARLARARRKSKPKSKRARR